jgi:hypothetical protein
MLTAFLHSSKIGLHLLLRFSFLLRGENVPVVRIIDAAVARIPGSPKWIAIIVVATRSMLMALAAATPTVIVSLCRTDQDRGKSQTDRRSLGRVALTAPGSENEKCLGLTRMEALTSPGIDRYR